VGRAVHRVPLDLRVYLWGGHAVLHDAALYRTAALGHLRFTYPPFAALVFLPLAKIPAVVASLLWGLVSVAALGCACHLALRLGRFRRTALVTGLLVAASLGLEPVRHTLLLGQVNLILLALVLWDIDRVDRDRRAGVGIGLATAVKLVPGLFVVLLAGSRRWRDAATAVATAIAATFVGFALAPHASLHYWRHEFFDTGRLGIPYISNQSVLGAAARLLNGRQHVAGWWYLPLVLAVTTAGMTAAVRCARRADWLAAVAVTGVTSLLASPVSWTHHWVWVMPALLVLVRRGTAGQVAAVLGYVLFVTAPMWWTPHHGGPGEYGWHGAGSAVANAYLVAAVLFLGYLTRSARQPSRLGYGRNQ
jgi:alpha-1,2-mannosyltransferase